MQNIILRPKQTRGRMHKFNIKDRWAGGSGVNVPSFQLLNPRKLERHSTLSPNAQSQHVHNNEEWGTALPAMKAAL